MHLTDIISRDRTTFSFEFFPPKSEHAADLLFETIRELDRLQPSFVSVTYGAGGSTRTLTRNLVLRIKDQTNLDTMPHLTCIGHTEDELLAFLDEYAAHGIGTIMALRGDRPNGGPTGSFNHAVELVELIRRFNDTPGNHPDPRGFAIAVAGYPEGHPDTPNRLDEMDHLKAKVDAGADAIITQLFFENRDFYDFRDRCRLAGIGVPIIAGIMPITSLAGMKRMSELALGARFPSSLIRALNRTGGDDEAVRRVGVHWATEQCRALLDHEVQGIHFYTLNRSTATREVYKTLGVKDSRALR